MITLRPSPSSPRYVHEQWPPLVTSNVHIIIGARVLSLAACCLSHRIPSLMARNPAAPAPMRSVRSHCPVARVFAGCVLDDTLGWISIHQRAQVQRMAACCELRARS